MTALHERFTGDDLDPSVWVPCYLPHWSSRESSRATYAVGGGELRLWIPPEQPLWAEGIHETPLRVSGIQSASFSGPPGSTVGGQPFKPGLTVREEQPEFWGHTQLYGHLAIRMRATLSPRSMVSFWLAGIEDVPEHSAEICVMEVFGTAPHDFGMGLHAFRDPGITEEWGTVPLDVDVAEFHTYAVDWRPGSVEFSVDGTVVKRAGQAPDYPVQLEIAVFDFPERAHLVPGDVPTPELVVTEVIGRPADPAR